MADVQLDCQGLNCPIPIVRISQTMKKIESRQTLEVIANDPAFSADVKAWVKKMGHTLLELEEGEIYRAIIQKS
jgi:tRNA 2-thiouridine synthesizing protein A